VLNIDGSPSAAFSASLFSCSIICEYKMSHMDKHTRERNSIWKSKTQFPAKTPPSRFLLAFYGVSTMHTGTVVYFNVRIYPLHIVCCSNSNSKYNNALVSDSTMVIDVCNIVLDTRTGDDLHGILKAYFYVPMKRTKNVNKIVWRIFNNNNNNNNDTL